MDALTQSQLDHNHWATREILDACRELSDEQFSQEFNIGPGSLQQTLAHVIEAMNYFACNFRGEEYERPEDFEERASSVDGLVNLLDEADEALQSAVGDFFGRMKKSMTDSVPFPFASMSVPAAIALAQVFDHGTHHRVQCINIMRQLGRADPVRCYPLRWAKETGAAT